MAVSVAHEASSSSSRCSYHVFLSFRGKDTRKNFTDHLYTALVQRGIHTFRDDVEIRKGKYIDAELQRAIRESKISIIVFSKDFASSRWCLDELVRIMECSRTFGFVVLPVFYDVDPSQVRNQSGRYAKAFDRHEEYFKNEMGRVKRWRSALKEVADLGGMPLQDRHEAQFVQDIVKEVDNKLKRKALHVSQYLVGVDKHIEIINLWVQEEANDVSVAVISGIGGIGKTAIAKVVFNSNLNSFEFRSFLANIRETSEQNNGLVQLQKQLLSDISGGQKHKIHNVCEGLMKIKDALCCRRVLLVLDDVDEVEKFNAIIGMCKWLYRGSKVIITTRNEHLLRIKDVQKAFKINELGYEDSLRLFCRYAFGECHPVERYKDLSQRLVQHCGGLPLALQTLGSSLSGKSIKVWESALEKLKAIPNSKVLKILRISYDSLQDDHDKNLFLDIACFFNGKDRKYSCKILDGCGFHTIDGVQNLIDSCLLTIDEDNKLRMHCLIRDMGREIIRQESPEDPGRRSRLWHNKDAFNLLLENMGTETIKGLTLDLFKSTEEKHIDDEDLETKSFAKMHKLKLLQLDYVKLHGDYDCFPKSLIWLRWQGFPLESIPAHLNMKKLVVLDLRYSSLKRLWSGAKSLPCLRDLDLSHSHGLTETPEFTGMPSLEMLKLKDCTSLVELDESLEDLTRLACLNLKGCRNLFKLPRRIDRLGSLEELNLSGCSRLEELPEDLRNMKSLKYLHLDGIAMNELRFTTRSTDKLDVSSAESLALIPMSQTRLAGSISFPLAFLPSSLVKLKVADCNISDDVLVNILDSLCSLTYLDLSGNPISTLPESICILTKLMFLKLDRCKELQSLPMLPFTLMELSARNCSSLERLVNIPNFTYSLFNFIGCDKLLKVPGMFTLKPKTNFHFEGEDALTVFPAGSAKTIKVTIRSVTKDTKLENVPLQALWKCGIMSIFLPGNKVSQEFRHKSAPVIAFDVPPGNPKVFGINLSGVYTTEDPFKLLANIIFRNKTKGIRWIYTPNLYATPGTNADMVWLSHLDFGDRFEGGDHVSIVMDMGCNFELKSCGVFLIHEPDDGYNAKNSPSWYLTSTEYKEWRILEEHDIRDHRIIRRDHLWFRRAEHVSEEEPDAATSQTARLK